MTLVATDWLSISINLLLVIFVIVCLLMTLLILMQRPKQEGLGAAFGGGVTDQVFGARTTNVLQRGTVYLGTLFFFLALILAILIGHQNKDSALLQKDKPVAEEAGADADGGDTTNDTGSDPEPGDLPSSLLDELPEEESAPGAETEVPSGDAEQKPEASESGEPTEEQAPSVEQEAPQTEKEGPQPEDAPESGESSEDKS